MNDFLGQELVDGDYVAGNYSDNNTPHFFKVVGRTPNKIRLAPIEDDTRQLLKFPEDLVKVPAAAVQATIALPPVDALGQVLKIGDTVYASNGEYINPIICVIENFVPHMVVLKKVYGEFGFYGSGTRLLTDVIKIESPAKITMHCLTQEN